MSDQFPLDPVAHFKQIVAALEERQRTSRIDLSAEIQSLGAMLAMLESAAVVFNNTRDVLNLAYDLCPEREPRDTEEWRAVLWSGQLAALLKLDDIMLDEYRSAGGAAYLQRLRARLVKALSSVMLSPIERIEAGRVLGRLGDPRPEVLTVDALSFCYVPAGPFWRGDDRIPYNEKGRPGNLDTAHDYWLSQWPITNRQFQQFVDAGGYTMARYWIEAQEQHVWESGQVITHHFADAAYVDLEERDSTPPDFVEPLNFPNHPVRGVIWYEALAFTRWLTERWQWAGRLPSPWVVRLPSADEWEKAARGGVQIPAVPLIGWPEAAPRVVLIDNPLPQRRYPWGDELDRNCANYANYTEMGFVSTSVPGCFSRGMSPYGVQDLSGNVWEWCATKSQGMYEHYDDDNDPHGAEDRVLRGGVFGDINGERPAPCAYCSAEDSFYRYGYHGFRICVSSPL